VVVPGRRLRDDGKRSLRVVRRYYALPSRRPLPKVVVALPVPVSAALASRRQQRPATVGRHAKPPARRYGFAASHNLRLNQVDLAIGR